MARTTVDAVGIRPEPTTDRDPITILPTGTEVRVTGPAVVVAGVRWWPVDDPMAGLSGFVSDDAIEPRDRPTPTPPPEETGDAAGVRPGDLVVVGGDDIAYRPAPNSDQDPIRVVLRGEELTVTGVPVAEGGARWLPVVDVFGVAGYVAAEAVALVGRVTPAPTPTAVATAVPAAAPADLPDLRSVELTFAIESRALAAGDAEAIADLGADLEQHLRTFRRSGCRPALVVLAVGAAESPPATVGPAASPAVASPETISPEAAAIAAAAVVEAALRDVYQPVFRSLDILRFADAGTLPDRVRLRVYFYEC